MLQLTILQKNTFIQHKINTTLETQLKQDFAALAWLRTVMKKRAYKILIFFLLVSAKIVMGQSNSKPICFNHSLLVLDSTTYEAAIHSDFLSNQFAFASERQLTGYHGFYLIGSTNYIELFHQNSFDGELLDKGEIYICFASLKANYLNTNVTHSSNANRHYADEDFNYFGAFINDTANATFETWEMKQGFYESWTKKKYNDSIDFLPVDYNSREESDSSFHYLMNDVIGMTFSVNQRDTSTLIHYLNAIGFKRTDLEKFKFLSNNQFIELEINEFEQPITLKKYTIRLNKSVALKTEIIGNSTLKCEGNLATWIFN